MKADKPLRVTQREAAAFMAACMAKFGPSAAGFYKPLMALIEHRWPKGLDRVKAMAWQMFERGTCEEKPNA